MIQISGLDRYNLISDPIEFGISITDIECGQVHYQIFNRHNLTKIHEGGIFPLCAEKPGLPSWGASFGVYINSPDKRSIMISEAGDFQVVAWYEHQNGTKITTEQEFSLRQNMSGVSLDRTTHPVPWDRPPLKQLKDGVDPREVSCDGELMRIYHPKSNIPACVKESTFYNLLPKGWHDSIPPPKCPPYKNEDPVCGIDGITYADQCHLNARGMKMEHRGECSYDEKLQSNTVHTTSIIQFGKNYDSKLLPVVYVVKVENTEKLDDVTFYDFQLLGMDRGHGSNNWDFVPKRDRIFTQLIDEQGVDAIDRTRMPEHYVIDDVLRMHELDCSGNTIHAESGPEITLPIVSGLSQVTKIDSETGIYPDSDGRYTIEFASSYDTMIELPAESTTILYETVPCDDPNDPDNKFAQYTKVIFQLE